MSTRTFLLVHLAFSRANQVFSQVAGLTDLARVADLYLKGVVCLPQTVRIYRGTPAMVFCDHLVVLPV